MIEIIIGTMRPGAFSRKVGNEVFDIYKTLTNDAGSTGSPQVGLIDLRDMPKEAFYPEAFEDRPRAITEFSDRLLKADGVVIVIPEYNAGVPGVMKHFIDLWKYPETFRRKFSIISVSSGSFGGIRASGHLGEILLNRGGLVFPKKILMPNIESLFNEKDEMISEKDKMRLQENAKDFLNFVSK